MAEEKQEKKQEKAEVPTKGSPAEGAKKEEINLIIRVAGVDLDGNKTIISALTKIKGIGVRTAKNITTVFEKETGISGREKMGKVSEENARKLEEIINNPVKAGIPKWSLNRQKDIYTGEDKHLVMSDLDFTVRTDFQRLSEIKSYRGLRHTWGLPVRGQRNKGGHRGKGGIVGVTKKEVKK